MKVQVNIYVLEFSETYLELRLLLLTLILV